MIACCADNPNLKIIDRKQKRVIKEINILKGEWPYLVKMNNYDNDLFPYLIIKDERSFFIFDTKLLKVHRKYAQDWNEVYLNAQIVEIEYDNKIKIISHNYDTINNEAQIKSFVIAQRVFK